MAVVNNNRKFLVLVSTIFISGAFAPFAYALDCRIAITRAGHDSDRFHVIVTSDAIAKKIDHMVLSGVRPQIVDLYPHHTFRVVVEHQLSNEGRPHGVITVQSTADPRARFVSEFHTQSDSWQNSYSLPEVPESINQAFTELFLSMQAADPTANFDMGRIHFQSKTVAQVEKEYEKDEKFGSEEDLRDPTEWTKLEGLLEDLFYQVEGQTLHHTFEGYIDFTSEPKILSEKQIKREILDQSERTREAFKNFRKEFSTDPKINPSKLYVWKARGKLERSSTTGNFLIFELRCESGDRFFYFIQKVDPA